MRDIVSNVRERYKDFVSLKKVNMRVVDEKGNITPKELDSMEAASVTMGFGLPQTELNKIGSPDGPRSPSDVAANVIVHMNNDIVQAEKKESTNSPQPADQRVPSSTNPPSGARTGPRINSVMVDVEAFDKFLDQVWPESAKRQ